MLYNSTYHLLFYTSLLYLKLYWNSTSISLKKICEEGYALTLILSMKP